MSNRKFFLAIAAITAISGLLLAFIPNASATVSGGSITGNAAADLVVGAADADYNVSFDTSATSTATTITVTFPTGYTITDGVIGTVATAICNGGCTVNGVISVDGVNRNVDSVVGNAAGRTIVVTLSSAYDLGTGTGTSFRLKLGITNRTVSGATGTFSITSNASGEVAQTNVAGVTLTPGAATVLVYTTQPSGSVSGIALTGQPVVTARDQYANTDTNFTEIITLTEASAGTLTNATTSAVSGVATFTNLIYTAFADQESFTLTADDEAGGTDLSSVNADAVTSNVVATKILVTTQPGAIISGVSMTQPVVKFVDAQDTLDTVTRTDVVTITENGTGSITAGTTGVTATGGIATYSGLIYSAAADDENVTFTFTDDAAANPSNFNGAPVNSNALVADVLATKLVSTVDPATCVSGLACTTQATIQAQNAQNLLDNDYITAVTAAETGLGALVGTANQGAMTAGSLSTVGLGYTATVDQESFTFTFDSGTLTQDVTASITSDVVATKILVTTAPASVVSGVSMIQPIVKYVNAQDTVDTAITATDTVAVTVSTGSLAGTQTVSASSGVVTFTDLVYTATADHATTTFTFTDNAGGDKNFSGAPVSSTNIDPNVLATVLVYTTQPSGSVSGIALTGQPVLESRDAGGLKDTDYVTNVALTVATGPGALTGTTTLAPVAGVVTFTNIIYTATADQEAFTILAASGSLTSATSSSVTSDVVATKLIFSTQPAHAGTPNGNVVSGTVFATQPIVSAVNAQNTVDTGYTSTVTLSKATGAGVVAGTLTKAAVSGVADFSGQGVKYTATADQQTFSLAADQGALTQGVSSTLTADVVATVIAVTTQPDDAAATNGDVRNGIVFATQPVITYRDAAGITDTNVVDPVTVSLTVGTGTFGGTTTKAAVSGVATFTDLLYTLAAGESDQQSITLSFVDDATGTVNLSASPVTDASTVDVVATQVVIQTQPASIISGVSMTQPVVRYLDAQNKVDTNVTDTLTATEGGAGSLAGTAAKAAVSGVVTYTNLVYTAITDQESVTFTFTDDVAGIDLSTPPINSNALVANVVATKIIVSTQPSGSVSGIALTGQPVIYFTDANNTLDTVANTDQVTVSVFSGGGSVSGTTAVSASNGVVTFTNLVYTATADQQAFVLRFTDDAAGTNAFNGSPVNATSTVSNVVATKFLVTLASYTPTAGATDTMTLTAANAQDTTDTGYNPTGLTFSFLDSGANALSTHTSPNSTSPTIPTSTVVIAAFSGGQASLATFTLVEAEVLGAITVNDGSLSGTSASVTVRHGTTASHTVSSSTATPTAGTAFNLTVTAKDAYGNTANGANGATAYTGVIFITTSGTAPYTLSPSSYPFVSGDAGTKTFTNGVTLNTVESGVSVTARDFTDATITGTVGSLNVSAAADTTAPVITDIQSGSITSSGATITWTTNETASSTVEYGLTSSYGSATTTASLVTSHSMALTGLSGGTVYHFRVKSSDGASNLVTSVDNTFTTSASDVTGPTISSQTPLDNATGTAVTVSPVLTFNEALDASTVNGATVQLRSYSDNAAVSATVSYNSASTTVTVDPIASLANSTQYYLYAVGVKDSAGNALTTDYSATTKATHEFTTAAESNGTLAVTGISALSTFATANDTYASGWSWIFSVTVPTSETSLTMKFADWISGSNSIAAANNIRFYSVQSSNATSSSPITITAANTYSSAMTLNADLDANTVGRQIQITVEAKVPTGSAGGAYSTSYGVQSQ